MRILRINVDKSFDVIEISLEDSISRSLKKYIGENGTGSFKILEKFDYLDHHYTVYGFNEGYNFNSFDLAYCNATGDIIITCCLNNIPVNIEPNNIRNFYRGEDLDDTLIQDELEQEYLDDKLNDSYEYDSWCVKSDDEGGDYPDYTVETDEDQ